MASVQAIVSRANGSIATPVQACSAVHAPGAKGPGLYGSTEGEGHLRKRIPKAKAKLLTSWCPELQTRTPQPKAQGARSSATMQTFLARFERLRSRQRLLVGQVKTKAYNYTVLMKYQAGPQNHFKFCRAARSIRTIMSTLQRQSCKTVEVRHVICCIHVPGQGMSKGENWIVLCSLHLNGLDIEISRPATPENRDMTGIFWS